MSDELSGFEQSSGPKRKRTSTVSLACSHCRKKHVKCDGKQPCSRCRANNLDCSFEQSEKKRGPVIGKLASVRKGLTSLKDELAKQKELAEEWERKYKALTASREGMQLMNLSKHAKTNALLAMSYTFNDYVNKYYAYAFPFFKVAPPLQHVDQFAQNQDPAKLSCMYSMLGAVAMAVGNTNQVKEFVSTAKALVTPIYDSMDPYVATTHTILSRVFLLVGDYERSNFYNAMAQTIANNLLARRETSSQVVRGVDLLHISRLATMWSLRVDNEYEKQLALFDEVINDMTHTLKDNVASVGFDILPFYATMLISKVWVEGYLIFLTKQKPDAALLQRWLATLDHAHNTVLQSTLASWSKKVFVVSIEASKAWTYLFSGHHEAALQVADVVMSMLDSEMSNLIFAIPSLVMVSAIYLFLRQYDKFHQSIQTLELFGEKHVLAAVIMKALNDFKNIEAQQKLTGVIGPPDLVVFMTKFGEFLVQEGSKFRLLMPEVAEDTANPLVNNNNFPQLQQPSPPSSTLLIENLPSPSQFPSADLVDELESNNNNPHSPSMAFYSYPNQASYNPHNAMHGHTTSSSSHSSSESLNGSPIGNNNDASGQIGYGSGMNNNNQQRGPNSAVTSMLQSHPNNSNHNEYAMGGNHLARYGSNMNNMQSQQQYAVPPEFYESTGYEVVADDAQAHMNNVLGMASTISEMKMPKFTYL